MKIIFVYNAEAGFMNGMMDSVHKIVSPSTYACSLCAVTHGAFSMDKDWRAYLKALPHETVFHHRKDFYEAYPDAKVDLPAVLTERDGALVPLLSAKDLADQETVNGLIAALDRAINLAGAAT